MIRRRRAGDPIDPNQARPGTHGRRKITYLAYLTLALLIILSRAL